MTAARGAERQDRHRDTDRQGGGQPLLPVAHNYRALLCPPPPPLPVTRQRGKFSCSYTMTLRHADKGVDAPAHGSRFRGSLGVKDSSQWAAPALCVLFAWGQMQPGWICIYIYWIYLNLFHMLLLCATRLRIAWLDGSRTRSGGDSRYNLHNRGLTQEDVRGSP